MTGAHATPTGARAMCGPGGGGGPGRVTGCGTRGTHLNADSRTGMAALGPSQAIPAGGTTVTGAILLNISSLCPLLHLALRF